MKKWLLSIFLLLFTYQVATASQTENTAELEAEIAAGLDVNTRDEEGNTLFYWFVTNSMSLKPLQILADAGADVNAPSAATGMTPLVYATSVAENARKNAYEQFSKTQTPVERQIAEATLKKEIKEKLLYAIELTRFLIKSGADINQETPFGTPLMSASTSDWNIDLVDYLLDSGADVNQRDRNGRTALFYAAAYKSEAVTIKLLAAGADINIKDNDGKNYMEISVEDLQK